MNVINLIETAIKYDQKGRRMEALRMYEDGIEELLQKIKDDTDTKRKETIQMRINEYLKRAEYIKKELRQMSTKGEIKDKIFIMEGAVGFGYEKVFGKYLNQKVDEVWIEEPYLVEHYQLCNLVKFCELIVAKCKNLRYIHLTTGKKGKENDQKQSFDMLAANLKSSKNISFHVEYDEFAHDRQIILSNGFIIKVGRGLHYFNATAGKYNLGMFDYDFRTCKQTNIDIYLCPGNGK